MKGVLPWLVRWAWRAGTRDFCSVLAALAGPVQNIFFLTIHYFNSFVPIRPASWAGSRAGTPVPQYASLESRTEAFMPRRREIVPAGSSALVWPTPEVGSTAPAHVSQISQLYEQKKQSKLVRKSSFQILMMMISIFIFTNQYGKQHFGNTPTT
jgi:hypothetical protein